jgi:hypothetical protein
MRRLAQVGLVLCLLVLAASWTASVSAVAGPVFGKAQASLIVAKVKPICSVEDKCMFLKAICLANCKCPNPPKSCTLLCKVSYRKCLKMPHTSECWDAAKQAEIKKKYLKDCAGELKR